LRAARPLSGSQGACVLRYGPCEAAALQERMKRAVALLGEDEVRTILETEGRIEARHLTPAPTVWRLVPLLVLGQGMGWVLPCRQYGRAGDVRVLQGDVPISGGGGSCCCAQRMMRACGACLLLQVCFWPANLTTHAGVGTIICDKGAASSSVTLWHTAFDHKVLAAACRHPFAASCVAICNVTIFQGHLQHAQAATGPGSPAFSQALCLKHSCVHSPLTLKLAASYQLLYCITSVQEYRHVCRLLAHIQDQGWSWQPGTCAIPGPMDFTRDNMKRNAERPWMRQAPLPQPGGRL